MADQRLGAGAHNDRNHLFELAAPSGRLRELYLRSESPRVQQMILHHKLKEEIAKNSAGRTRYIDSEIHLRNVKRSQAQSETQSTTLNIGGNPDHLSTSVLVGQSGDHSPAVKWSPGEELRQPFGGGGVNIKLTARQQAEQSAGPRQFSASERASDEAAPKVDHHQCRVCFLKEMRQDFMNMHKVVQERNEQFSKLKSLCLKSNERKL